MRMQSSPEVEAMVVSLEQLAERELSAQELLDAFNSQLRFTADPEDAILYLEYAASLALLERNEQLVLTILRAAIELKPDAMSHVALSNALVVCGDWIEAQVHMEHALTWAISHNRFVVYVANAALRAAVRKRDAEFASGVLERVSEALEKGGPLPADREPEQDLLLSLKELGVASPLVDRFFNASRRG